MLLRNRFLSKWQSNDALEELQLLSRISSSHKEPKGILKVLQHTANELKALGFHCDYIMPEKEGVIPLLEANLGESKDMKIAMVAHADTVLALKKKKHIQIEGDYIKGPGVADNKAGIVCLLESLRKFLKYNQQPPFQIKVIISPEEEIGSPNFLQYFSKTKESIDFAFGFEPSMANGDIIIQRDGNYWLEVDVEGVSAHCGRARGEEINAYHDFSQKYQSLLKETKRYQDLRMNLAAVETTNKAFNVVCGDLKAKIDIRFSDFDELNHFIPKAYFLLKKKQNLNNQGQSAAYTFNVRDCCPPMSNHLKLEHFFYSYLGKVKQLEGKEIKMVKSGGASDLSYLSTTNNICVDGLAAISSGMHRYDESVYIPSLKSRPEAFASLLRTLSINEYGGFNG